MATLCRSICGKAIFTACQIVKMPPRFLTIYPHFLCSATTSTVAPTIAPKVTREHQTFLAKVFKKLTPRQATEEELIDERYINAAVPRIYYQCVQTGYDFIKFIEHFKLEDDITTWFRIAVLHLWMIFVRMSKEKEDFYMDFKAEVINSLWEDCRKRYKMLSKNKEKVHISNREMNKLMENLYGYALITMAEYDEVKNLIDFIYDQQGLLSDDTLLAGAIWRNMYLRTNDYDVTVLNDLVRYTRIHIHELHKVDFETLMANGFVFNHFNYSP